MEEVDVGISLVVQGLDKVLIHEAGLLQGVKNKVDSLKHRLLEALAFLKNEDANRRLIGESVRRRKLQIRQMAYEAEDVVEMFLVKAAYERRSRGCFKSIITKRGKTGEEFDIIRVRLEDILRMYRRDDNEQVVGMEDEVKKLLRESVLDEEKKGLSIAVVEGMAGIGKTTFAQKIYHHPDVVASFQCCAWVMGSSEFTVVRTMKQLILQLLGSDKQKLRELEESKKDVRNELQEMLYKLLQGKTYFIVLDDVWNMQHWESLKSAFPNEQDKTSRLLVTTRNKYIAKHERYTHYEMKLLDPEKSWELFLMKALISDGGCPEELEPIGREIVSRCEGLPLRIRDVGGFLRVKAPTKSEWEQVLNQLSSHLGSPESSVFRSLELSYQNLPPKLRPCFLHLALFKEDATIPAKTLLHIWVVQGLIQELEGNTAEESARQYLDELINRSMLQIVDRTMESRVKNIYLDGSLREVCLRRANEELVLETVKVAEGISFEFEHRPTRHAVVHGANIETLSLRRIKTLRSLFLHSDEGVDVDVDVNDLSNSCLLLKILHLDGIKLSKFPDSLGKLIRLKYLMIRHHKIHPNSCALDHLEAVKLPNWLDGLKHLEILDMEGEKVEFPNDVTLEMKRLRYFSAYCVRGPMSINSWENIETLKYMRQEDWMECYSRQSSSCNVRKLGLFLDPLSKPDERRKVRASLESLKKLEHLQLRWNRFIPFDPQIIPNFGSRLTKLKLRGRLSKCPDATIFPPNLSCLTLALSDLSEDLMAELSKLPKLSYLKLLGNAYKPERMQVLSDGFPCLDVLTLKEMFLLKSIDTEQGGMPRLEKLRIQQCPSLQTMNLPEHVVIERIS